MDSRVFILTIPSLAVLALLAAYSMRALPRSRALAFWVAVAGYGILRGVGVHWVTAQSGASFPYLIRKPLFPILGVSLQEIAGWAIVCFLAWWLGSRFSHHLFAQVAWACLFLGAISWAVESAAEAAGWWTWTVPVDQPLFLNVPFTGIVDWFFVGMDFLLPFAILTAPAARNRWPALATLLAFPFHFGAHALAGTSLPGTPIPVHHFVHWALIAILIWLSLRSPIEDTPFAGDRGRWRDAWMPLTALAIVVLDSAAVELAIAHRPKLLVSTLPVLAMALQTLRPAFGYTIGAGAAFLGALLPPLFVAAVPSAGAAFLTLGRRTRYAAVAAVAALAIAAYAVHERSAHREQALTKRLSAALAARDRGDLAAAKSALISLAAEFPESHVPLVFLGEIDYRTERLDEARDELSRAIRIKPDFSKGFRYLAVIDLRLGRKASAADLADRGLALRGSDVELQYLSGRAHDREDVAERLELLDPKTAQGLAALAFEVGDAAGVSTLLDRAIARWPAERSFYPTRVKLALQSGDAESARRVTSLWLDRFPLDAEARQLSVQLAGK